MSQSRDGAGLGRSATPGRGVAGLDDRCERRRTVAVNEVDACLCVVVVGMLGTFLFVC
jgi:hypothetical protein